MNMNYIQEVRDALVAKDPSDILDLLDITNEDLIERFDDKIEENLEDLIKSELGEIVLFNDFQEL